MIAAIMAGGKLLGAGMDIYSAYSGKKNAKRLYKAKQNVINERKKTVYATAKYNQQEIEEAFKQNYKNTAFQYGEKIRDVVSQAGDAKGKIEMDAVSNLSNVDLQGSSFMGSQLQKLETEFRDATATLHRNQTSAIMALADAKSKQTLDNTLGVIQAEKGFGMEEWQLKNDRDQAIKYQTAKMLEGGLNLLTAGRGAQKSFSALKDARKSPDYKSDLSAGNLLDALLSSRGGK